MMKDAEANHAGCDSRPGVHDHAQSVVPDPQPAEPLHPADRPLDHPTDLAPIRCRAASAAWRCAARCRAIAGFPGLPRCHTPDRRTPRRASPSAVPACPRPRGSGAPRGGFVGWSLALAPAVRIASGTPWRSTMSVCFVPFVLRSTGLGPVASPPPERPDGHAVDDHRVGVELARLAEQPEQLGVEAVPDPGLLPRPEPAVGGPPGAAEFRRDVLPAGTGGQDEPDHPDDDPVADPGPAALGADGLLGRQMVGDRLEEFLGHVGIGHAVVSPRGSGGLHRHGVKSACQRVLSDLLKSTTATSPSSVSKTVSSTRVPGR